MKPEPLPVVLRFRQQAAGSADVEGYYVEVVAGPSSGWGGPFLPEGLDDGHMIALRQLYRGWLARQQAAREPVDERAVEALHAAGSQLFRALPETVQTRLRESQAHAQARGTGLTLVLGFERDAQPLVSLPWELLHDREGGGFYALRGGGVIRQLWLPAASVRAASPPPRAMVGLWADPSDGESLAVRGAYPPAPGHDNGIVWLAGKDSLGQLANALESGDFDGLHLTAHGRAGGRWRDFSLALVDGDGKTHWLSPDQLAVFLAGYPQLRFVYLDVCAGAGSGNSLADSRQPSEGAQPGGLAVRLVIAGVPLVVAMQENVAQKAAGRMAEVFYRAWGQGASPAEAMACARRAVRIELDDPIHWSVPALYEQRRPPEAQGWSVRAADWVLDRVRELVQPGIWPSLAALVLIARLARLLGEVDMRFLAPWQTLALPVTESVLLVVLGGWAMRAGQDDLAETGLDRRGWLAVFLQKYFGAAIWVTMGWVWIWIGWLFLVWVGIAEGLSVAGRRGVWAVFLAGLAAAAYVGARQALRQSRLFRRLDTPPRLARDWLLFLAAPFFPLLILWAVTVFWEVLVAPLFL